MLSPFTCVTNPRHYYPDPPVWPSHIKPFSRTDKHYPPLSTTTAETATALAAQEPLRPFGEVPVEIGEMIDLNNNRHTTDGRRQMCQGMPTTMPCGPTCNCMRAVDRKARTDRVWTDMEKAIFLDKFIQYPKNFAKIASFLRNRTAKDCVKFYYDSKATISYKPLLKEVDNRRKNVKVQWQHSVQAATAVGAALYPPRPPGSDPLDRERDKDRDREAIVQMPADDCTYLSFLNHPPYIADALGLERPPSIKDTPSQPPRSATLWQVERKFKNLLDVGKVPAPRKGESLMAAASRYYMLNGSYNVLSSAAQGVVYNDSFAGVMESPLRPGTQQQADSPRPLANTATGSAAKSRGTKAQQGQRSGTSAVKGNTAAAAGTATPRHRGRPVGSTAEATAMKAAAAASNNKANMGDTSANGSRKRSRSKSATAVAAATAAASSTAKAAGAISSSSAASDVLTSSAIDKSSAHVDSSSVDRAARASPAPQSLESSSAVVEAPSEASTSHEAKAGATADGIIRFVVVEDGKGVDDNAGDEVVVAAEPHVKASGTEASESESADGSSDDEDDIAVDPKRARVSAGDDESASSSENDAMAESDDDNVDDNHNNSDDDVDDDDDEDRKDDDESKGEGEVEDDSDDNEDGVESDYDRNSRDSDQAIEQYSDDERPGSQHEGDDDDDDADDDDRDSEGDENDEDLVDEETAGGEDGRASTDEVRFRPTVASFSITRVVH